MIIKFDNTTINNNLVYGLHKSVALFSQYFELGRTICKEYELKVDNSLTIPSIVTIDSEDLIVDSVEKDTNFYTLTLVDKMILLNTQYDYSSIATLTVQNVLNAMCTNVGLTAPTLESSIGSITIAYYTNMTPRQLVSYIAELKGGFAYVNGNNLYFGQFGQNNRTILLTKCKDFSVGTKHQITKVILKTSLGTYTSGTNTGDTLYLNPDNILFMNNIQTLLDNIVASINTLEFYPIKTSRCILPSVVNCGDQLTFTDGTNSYTTIAQIDFDYNGLWMGGFDCDFFDEKYGTYLTTNSGDMRYDQSGTAQTKVSELETEMVNGTTTINGGCIATGTLSANTIKGGSLTLGGANNVFGQLFIKDASNNTIGTWNNNGIVIIDDDVSAKFSVKNIDESSCYVNIGTTFDSAETEYAPFLLMSGKCGTTSTSVTLNPTGLTISNTDGQTNLKARLYKKLWTNASPTSSFAAQTLTISNMAYYSRILIVVKAWNESLTKNQGYFVRELDYGYGTELDHSTYNSSGSGTSAITYVTRHVEWTSATDLVFGDGNMVFLGASYSGRPEKCVPIEIWGVK